MTPRATMATRSPHLSSAGCARWLAAVLSEDLIEDALRTRELLRVLWIVVYEQVASAFHRAQPRPRAQDSSSTDSRSRNACRPSAVSNVQAMARSQAGSPTPHVPKSMTAASCPSSSGPRRELLVDGTTYLLRIDGDALWHGTEIRRVTQRNLPLAFPRHDLTHLRRSWSTLRLAVLPDADVRNALLTWMQTT